MVDHMVITPQPPRMPAGTPPTYREFTLLADMPLPSLLPRHDGRSPDGRSPDGHSPDEPGDVLGFADVARRLAGLVIVSRGPRRWRSATGLAGELSYTESSRPPTSGKGARVTRGRTAAPGSASR
jgi:hypothetical protein